jgi:hypothetical protein
MPALSKKRSLMGARHGRGSGVQALFDVEQQDLVELGDGLGRPVIARIRTSLARMARFAIGWGLRAVAKRFGHRGLQVEHQPVFAAAGKQVQARADQAQQGLVALDLAHLKRRGQALAASSFPALAQSGSLGHPQNDLQVAQAAG